MLCLLRLSPFWLTERTWWDLCADQQATVIAHYNSRTPLVQSNCPPLAMDKMWTGQTSSTMHLLQPCTFFLEPKSKCCFVGWHSLWANVGQPPLGLVILVESWLCHRPVCVFTTLCSDVYVICMCVEAATCILLPLFLYIMKLCVLSFYKTHNFVMYTNNGNKCRNVLKSKPCK